VYSQHSSVWASRYLTTLLGPLLLLGGAAIARAGIAGLAALAVVAVSWWQLPPYHSVALKSNVERVAARTARHLHPGDLVLVIQPESTPVVRYYLGPRLRYATLLGRVHDPGVMDWRDGLQRLRAAKPAAVVSLVNHLRPGRRIALVRPASWAGGQHAPWTRLLKRKGRTLARELAGDHRIRQIAAIPPGERGSRSNVRAVVYVRRA
jgi:hypothetical protein